MFLLIFTPTWENDPICLIFFAWVETHQLEIYDCEKHLPTSSLKCRTDTGPQTKFPNNSVLDNVFLMEKIRPASWGWFLFIGCVQTMKDIDASPFICLHNYPFRSCMGAFDNHIRTFIFESYSRIEWSKNILVWSTWYFCYMMFASSRVTEACDVLTKCIYVSGSQN